MSAASNFGMALALTLLPGLATLAETIADRESEGMSLVAASAVTGVFEGCDRGRRIAFRDGTVFSCGEQYTHFAVEPRAEIYRDSLGQRWTVAIAGRAYAGTLVRLRGVLLSTPRLAEGELASPLPQPVAGAVAPVAGLQAAPPLGQTTALAPSGGFDYPAKRATAR